MDLTVIQLLTLVAVFFATSVISVITGSTSLITVPVLLQMGLAPRTALATNMLALTLMSTGATLPFLKRQKVNLHRLPLLMGLTVIGSVVGAGLVLVVSPDTVPQIVAVCMVAVTIFSLVNQQGQEAVVAGAPRVLPILGYAATLGLGIYGGFFSGGYVTLLTAAYVALFRMTFIEAIATTKLVNVASSLVATVVFAVTGIVDYPLGMLLGLAMFMGGILGSHFALRLHSRWLRRIFLVTVIVLALKTFIG
jgi:uncharacterized protein